MTSNFTRFALFIAITACAPDAYQVDAQTGQPDAAVAATHSHAFSLCGDSMDLELYSFTDTRDIVEKTPSTPSNPEDPQFRGWAKGGQAGPRSLLRPNQQNNLTGELVNLEIALGGTPVDERDQLAFLCEQGFVPDEAVMPLVRDVTAADVTVQVGEYYRLGRMVVYRFRIAYTNTTPASDALTVKVEAPFEQFNVAGEAVIGDIFLANSNFQTENQALGFNYYSTIATDPPDDFVRVFAIGAIATVAIQILIGNNDGGGGEGPRSVSGQIIYPTNGVRNLAWPFIKITNLTHSPILDPQQTAITYLYDAATALETVELFKDGAPLPTPFVQVVTTTPRGRGTFDFATAPNPAELTAAVYTVVYRGVTSNAFTIDHT